MKKLFMMFLFFCSIVFSQENLMDLTLEELLNIEVTTASKSAQKSSMAPATIVVISDEQIKTRGYRSMNDLLRDLPGFNITNAADPRWYNSVYVRGLGEQEKFVILLNGIKISSPTGEMLPIIENYPVYLAKQVEIIYGPASALYGADAVSGVINIITNDDKENNLTFSLDGGNYNSVNVSTHYFKDLSNGQLLTAGLQYYYEAGPDMSKYFKDNDDYGLTQSFFANPVDLNCNPLRNKDQIRNKFEIPIYAYNAFVKYKNGNFALTYFGNYARHSSSLDLPPNKAVYNKEAFFGQYINTVDGRYNYDITENLSAISSVTFSRYDLDNKSMFWNYYTAFMPGYKISFGTMSKVEQQFNYKYSENNSWILGVFFENYYSLPKGADLEYPVSTDKDLNGVILGTVYPYTPQGIQADMYLLRYFNTGSYLQTQYNPTDDIYLTFGLRYDYNSRFGSTINPRAGLVYQLSKKTTFKLLYGSAFLAVPPRVEYDYYGGFVSTDSGKTFKSYFFHLPNPGIKPVKSQTFEVGVKSYLTDALGVSINAFYSIYKDLYADDFDVSIYNNTYKGWPVSTIIIAKNKEKQTNYGGEVEFNYLFKFSGNDKLLAYLSVSYVDGFMDSKAPNGKNYQISNYTPLMIKGGFDLTLSDFSFSPRVIYNSKSRLNKPIGNTEKMTEIDGYFILNTNLEYKINDILSLKLNVANALDSRYYAVGSSIGALNPKKGQPQRPIHIMGGLSLNL